MNKILFSYEQLDGWDNLISKINVYDQAENNVVCTMPHESIYNSRANEETDEFVCTLPKSELNKIVKIIKDSGILQIDEDDVEEPFVLDGYMNLFVFYDRKTLNEMCVSNIWYYRENFSVYARQILEAFDKITKILAEHGVDQKYFSLGYYDGKQ